MVTKKGVKQQIESMEFMTQKSFTACLECGNSPVAEFRKKELEKFAKKHPDCAQFHRDIFPGGISEKIPDWQLVRPAICFITGVCCDCCEKNHKDIWDICQQARLDYERGISP